MHRRSVAAIAAILLVAAACASSGELDQVDVPLPASLAELTGPWRAEPYVLDSTTWKRAELGCIRDMEMPPGLTAAIVDARGAGVLSVRIVGVSEGGCDALQINRDGSIVGAGGGWSGTGQGGGVPRDTSLLLEQQGMIAGGNLTVQGWSVLGRAGPGIAAVVVDPLAGPPLVRATLLNGWFAAWWPALPAELAERNAPGLHPHVPPRVVIRGYDATGNQVDAIQP